MTGMMILLLLGGVDTNSSQVLDGISAGNLSLWESSIFWIAITVALAGFLATNKISAGGFSFQATSESITAIFATGIFVFFAADLMSIMAKVSSITCPIVEGCTKLTQHTWEFWVIAGIIWPLLVGFGISIVNFVRGND